MLPVAPRRQRMRQTPTLDIQPERDPLATIAVSAAPVVLEGRYRLVMRALWQLRHSAEGPRDGHPGARSGPPELGRVPTARRRYLRLDPLSPGRGLDRRRRLWRHLRQPPRRQPGPAAPSWNARAGRRESRRAPSGLPRRSGSGRAGLRPHLVPARAATKSDGARSPRLAELSVLVAGSTIEQRRFRYVPDLDRSRIAQPRRLEI